MYQATGNVVITGRRRKLQITDRSIVTDTGSTLVRICSPHKTVQVLVSTSETVPCRRLYQRERHAHIFDNNVEFQFRLYEMFCNAILHDKQTEPRL